MRRQVVLLGDEVLRRKARPVSVVDAGVRKLIDDLTETMHDCHGLGLAAPQVAVSRRVLVAWDGEGEVIGLVNPQIKRKSGQARGTEGCLSIPGVYGAVPRAKQITIVGLDRAGRTVSISASGLLARALQHEVDHLNGVLFTDHTADLWWSELLQADDPRAAGLEPDEDGDRVLRTPTSVDEVIQHFAALRSEQGLVNR
ncbi:MAG: peptide deformylase [Fimbriimonadaceae bacterium]|nr:peptide deformylase [Fimbriimonadaceae bacterium]